jgi:hypothetical protein
MDSGEERRFARFSGVDRVGTARDSHEQRRDRRDGHVDLFRVVGILSANEPQAIKTQDRTGCQ